MAGSSTYLVIIVAAVVFVLLIDSTVAQLSREEKQLFLDSHNHRRASVRAADMNQIEWSTALEEKAQQFSEACNVPARVETGLNIAYNTSEAEDDHTFVNFVEDWEKQKQPSFGVTVTEQPVLWSMSSTIGCYNFLCPSLSTPGGGKYFNSYLVVCAYDPVYYMSDSGTLHTQSSNGCSGHNSRCRSRDEQAQRCISFRTESSEILVSNALCALSDKPAVVPEDDPAPPPPVRRVSNLLTRFGSVAGGTRCTLEGEGFSANQLDGGNRVIFVNVNDENDKLECDVIRYYTGPRQIVCDTRPARNLDGSSEYKIEVQVNDGSGEGFEDIEVCSYCRFTFDRGSNTPIVRNIEPPAATFGDVIMFHGDFYASQFNDTDEDEASDFYTRILVGGRGCNPRRDNGSIYGSTLDEDNLREATVSCQPENTFAIESSNATVILGKRGNSLIPLGSELLSLDNKLQPYVFQTHADIQGVSPNTGSSQGGTKISITVNAPLTDYPREEIKVYVGGVLCEVNNVIYSDPSQSIIECTTGPEPPQRNYYPGGRGVRREVFIGGNLDPNAVRLFPPSELTSIVDRLYRDSEYDTPEFGEDIYFSHRYTGFFVPPTSCMYTFNLRSDDLSQLYFSPNPWTTELPDTPFISVPQYSRDRWDYFPEQFSDPIFLEAGQPHYFQVVANQYPGPWDVGLAAKLHCLNETSYPYQGDREEQRINITSAVVREKIGVSLQALPAVKELRIYPQFEPNDNTNVSCPVPLAFAFAEANGEYTVVNVTVSPLEKPEDVEERLKEKLYNAGISTEIHVAIEFFGDQRSQEVGVRFLFISVTALEGDVPEIIINSDQTIFDCINLNNETDPIDESLLSVRVELNTVQNLTVPDSFKIGYENLNIMSRRRFTNDFPIDVSASRLQSAIFDLFGQGCMNRLNDQLLQQINVYQTYENMDLGGANGMLELKTSFCGHGSLNSPGLVWIGSSINIGSSPFQICFAYKGNFAGIVVRVSFQEVDPNTNIILSDGFRNLQLRSCFPSVAMDDDGWSAHQCIDLRTCLESLPAYSNSDLYNLRLRWVRFNTRADFWIDEFILMSGFQNIGVTRVSSQPRISPHDITVDAVEVIGEPLATPMLLPFSISGPRNESGSGSPCSNPGSNSSEGSGIYPDDYTNLCNQTQEANNDTNDEPKFVMVLSKFQILFSVLDCAYGLPLPVGYYQVDGYEPMTVKVDIEQEEEASRAVSGYFSVTIGDTTLQFPADITADQLETLMSVQFPEEGGFEVTRSGMCNGYSWDVSWKTKGGDQPLLNVSGEDLQGTEPRIESQFLLDGGTWIRPLRGDMLRVPKDMPQVEVIINDVPSSCRQDVCNFTFVEPSRVNAVYPVEGQGGTTITLYGEGFTDVTSDIEVIIGTAICHVTSSNDSVIECVASDHTAGWYNVQVKIEGRGKSAVNESVCFRYLLTVDNISPSYGGIGGGQIVTITGNGFMQYVNHDNDEFGIPEISTLPWFNYGIGLPYVRRIQYLNLCPAFEQELTGRGEYLDMFTPYHVVRAIDDIDNFFARHNRSENDDFELIEDGRFKVDSFYAHLFNIYQRLPSYVLIAGYPCIITESNFTDIQCVPALNLPQSANLSVVVLTEYVHMENVFEIDVNRTVLIDAIDPSQGAVVGNTVLTVTGYNFDAYTTEDVTVYVGKNPCNVTSAGINHIECILPPNGPSLEPVYVSTPNGVAVWKAALREQLEQEAESGGVDMSASGDESRDLPPFPVFTYKLAVVYDPSTPLRGSSFGGTLITLTGGIFIMGYTKVTFGGVEAEIKSINEREVTFYTPTSTRKHYIELDRTQLRVDNTVALSWSQPEIVIQVDDTVEWDWNLQIPGYQEFSFEIFETMDNESTQPFQGGFASSAPSTSLSVTFNEVGTFHYIGNTIKPANTLTQIRGIIQVSEPLSSTVPINVTVGGFEAVFVTEDEVSSGAGMVRQRRQAVRLEPNDDPCIDEVEYDMQSDEVPMFIYSVCNTPTVSYVTPQIGYGLTTMFTISGSLFSETELNNEVSFGNFSCNVVNSTTEEITCIISPDQEPPASFIPLNLSFQILDPSAGNAYISDRQATTIEIRPTIYDISPMAGSVEGGTDILITGQGFKCPDEISLQVTIGDLQCNVTNYNYTEIECVTEAVDSPRELNLSVWCGSADMSAMCVSGCSYSYSLEYTPMVTAVTPSAYSGEMMVTIDGSGFADQPQDNIVTIGGSYECTPVSAASSQIVCYLPALPANDYQLSVKVCNISNNRCFGYAAIDASASVVTSIANLTSVSPMRGSIRGGTTLTITGTGFLSDITAIAVDNGGSPCEVDYANYSTIVCITDANSEGEHYINVQITGLASFPQDSLSYEYSMNSTPRANTISPMSGQRGDMVTIEGSGFGTDPSSVSVDFDSSPCIVMSDMSSDSRVVCELGGHFAAAVLPEVTVEGVGTGITDNGALFNYILATAGSPSNSTGSFAGMNTITIPMNGADPANATITICGEVCAISREVAQTERELSCIVPPADYTVGTLICNITISSGGKNVTITNGYTYDISITPFVDSINRTRGGTEGGSPIMIQGSSFTGTARVEIAGTVCDVVEQTEQTIVCVTNRSGRTIRAPVLVSIDGNYAISRSPENTTFWFVDLWSSPFTWGGGPLPQEDEFVVIPRGQTLLLDVNTPILSYILIKGGELIFDPEKGDNEVSLHTQGGLITSGGRLQIGTEEEPFLAKTELVLYGHVLSTEIPVYGAKTLALREGVIDMHGKPINVTWTRLASTAPAKATQIELQDYVDWEVGGKIVLASTSFSQRENEEHTIIAITAGERGSILTLNESLQYEHISVQQTIDGRYIDTSGEVGYLTRNIVVRGNKNVEWLGETDACEREFRPGQFEVQSCFLGRFGPETLSDQFGSQIMIHGPEFATPDKTFVIGRFEYVEVTHAGQAFRLGRYPIHFHLNGNVSESYVRGCAIHHTFNRAVTIHAVDNLLVEKNVAYNIMGHAYFLEDGIEIHNIIQDNLGIFVRGSSSLLNVDITPATFWAVNAQNIIRRNAAAGGTHFGFWYNPPRNPTGPSATNRVCPRKQRVEEFADNTAHSFGWYGLWIFEFYFPTRTGECSDNEPAPSYFDRFLAWRNDRGVEFSDVGSLQLRDSIMMDNRLAGVEYTDLSNTEWGDQGPLIKNTLIVGHSDITQGDDSFSCTEAGIRTPHSYYLTVSGVTFANFDRPGCFPVQACSHCRALQGGFESRFEQINFINASNSQLTQWKWTHEHIHRDMDGTLTGNGVPGAPKLLIPTNGLLDPANCQVHPGSFMGGQSNRGSICDGSLQFGRIALFNARPNSIEFADISVVNDHGNDILIYRDKRLRGGSGFMAQLQFNDTYQLDFTAGRDLSNISYSLITSGFDADNYVIFSQQYPRELDMTLINGMADAVNESDFNNPGSLQSGNWFLGDNNTISYILKGDPNSIERQVTYATFRCFYDGCVPPPPPPPPTIPPPGPRCENVQRWSEASTWQNGVFPREGDNLFINSSQCILIDMEIPRLGMIHIEGDLEIEDSRDHVIEADLIILNGGSFIAGSEDNPFLNKIRIILHGNTSTTEFHLNDGASPPVGAKAIGAFGQLILISRVPEVTWTFLAQTAAAGSSTIQVEDSIEDWQPDDSIVITSTSYDAFEAEVHKIQSISGNTITLTTPLQYKHSGGSESIGSSKTFYHRAEVGLLTRKITIENGAPDYANQEAFGCRVLVSSNANYRGTAQLQGVEFSGCGQLGHTEDFDPRFALAFLNIGRQSGQDASYVKSCSFHDGYNTAIGVFLASNVAINDTVVHGTVGDSVIITGPGHMIHHNLASKAQFIGTYRERNEPANTLWTANFELSRATDFTFTNNAAAGGAKAGIHTHGEECTDSSQTRIRNNIAHSSLHCIHLGYGDGYEQCSRFQSYTLFNCYHYGLFSYGQAGIHITNCNFINNKAAIYVSVIGPPALSHVKGTKTVDIEDTLIVSASTDFDCNDDNKIPEIASHELSNVGIQSRTGGHVGIVVPSFISGRGHFPPAPWFSIISYPAITGLTRISDVTFANFQSRSCGAVRNDTVIMTNPASEDANHPVHFRSISYVGDINSYSRVFVQRPSLGRVNPSDCVDMDCDGHKQIVMKDLDGSFTQMSGDRTIITEAEFEWNGDERRGLGDYRIPRTMLTFPNNGSRIPINDIYPNQGIVRGRQFGDGSDCDFISTWNMYMCSNLDHLMLVLESLDGDTEVRRLSPIGLGANGFINLVNGPMDNGWCGGYTCQERISTFYTIVAADFDYTIALTSTNPQEFALHLINADNNQGIRVGIIYTNPQGLDVFAVTETGQEIFIRPTNTKLDGDGNIQYIDRDPTLSRDQFIPTLANQTGANFYDRDTMQLYIIIRGNETIKSFRIKTRPVIMLSLTLQVSVDEFFDEENLVRNIALLLGIPNNKIRIVNVVRETQSRRKRQSATAQTIDFEIGNQPGEETAPTTGGEGGMGSGAGNMTDSGNETATVAPEDDVLSFEDLQAAAERTAEIVQTGEITQSLNSTATVVSATIEEPEPPPEDPTGGVRATPDTGGPQPIADENGTFLNFFELQNRTDTPMTYDQLVQERENNETATSQPIMLAIPTRLATLQQIANTYTVLEGIAIPSHLGPQFAMYDSQDQLVLNLGLERPWQVTISTETGPSGGFLRNEIANFSRGIAQFDSLSFSHPGEYQLSVHVTYPQNTEFSASITIMVMPRRLELQVTQQPQNGNTSFPLYPHPAVQLRDRDTQEMIREHDWRNLTWFITAYVMDTSYQWQVELTNGEATFTNVSIRNAGTYRLRFEAYTMPRAPVEHIPAVVTSEPFTISELPITKFTIVYDVDYTDVIGGNETGFEQLFIDTFEAAFPGARISAISLSEGSIIVVIYIVAQTPQILISLASQLTANNGANTLTFVFNNTLLAPSNVTQDPNFIIVLPPSEDRLVLILATTIPAGTILIAGTLLIIVVYCCFRKKKHTKSFTIKVKPANMAGVEERYVQHKKGGFDDSLSDRSSIDEFYLLPQHKKDDFDTKSFQSHELDEFNSTASTPASQRKVDIITSTEISVPGTVFINPMTHKGDKIEQLSDLEGSIDEIWNKASDNSNNNNAIDLEGGFSLPNMVPDPEPVSTSRPGTGIRPSSQPGTGIRPSSQPGTGIRPGTGSNSMNSFQHQKLENVVVEEL